MLRTQRRVLDLRPAFSLFSFKRPPTKELRDNVDSSGDFTGKPRYKVIRSCSYECFFLCR